MQPHSKLVERDNDKRSFILTHLRGHCAYRYHNLKTHPDSLEPTDLPVDDLITDHLAGSNPMGMNLIKDTTAAFEDWRATALVFDVDAEDMQRVIPFVRSLNESFGDVVNVEYTGNHFHAWVFFLRPVLLSKVQALVHVTPAMNDIGSVLCYHRPFLPVWRPNLPMVLPWTKHPSTRQRSHFVDYRVAWDREAHTVTLVDEEYVDAVLAAHGLSGQDQREISLYWASQYKEFHCLEDVWDLPEALQRKRIEDLRISGIPEGQRNDVFVRQGYVLLLIKLHPDGWEDVGEEILLQGISDRLKRRERRRWWRKSAIPYYQQALADGRLALGRTRFQLGRHYRDSESAADAVEDLLDGHITSTTVLVNLVYLVLYMLDLQAEADRLENPTFFRSIGAMAQDVGGVYGSIQTLSRHLPFVVAGYRSDRGTGEDLCRVPIFRCVNKAEPWQEGKPRTREATEYQLNEEYRSLMDF